MSDPCAGMPDMPQQPHPTTDVSAITPAQRAQILREESIWIEDDWLNGRFDGGVKDLDGRPQHAYRGTRKNRRNTELA
jgi:hypothetical protein